MNYNDYFFPVILTDLNKPWEKVLSLGSPVTFAARSIIPPKTRPGDEGLYFIKKGRVRLSNISFNGQERIMLYMGSATLFNEVPMFQYSAGSAIFSAMESTRAVFFPKKIFTKNFIAQSPGLFLNLFESLSKKSLCMYLQLCTLRTMSSFGNVCRILYCMHLFNRVHGVVNPRLTQQELAAFLGIHRSSLHKTLNRLRDKGIIGTYRRNTLDIFEPEKLKCCAIDETACN
jgi:CRP-like cAMP-binding protein